MFAIGKLPPEILEKIVMEPMQASRVKREDVILRPKTGEDCSAVDWAENIAFCPQTPLRELRRMSAIWRCRLTATIFIPPVRSRWAFF